MLHADAIMQAMPQRRGLWADKTKKNPQKKKQIISHQRLAGKKIAISNLYQKSLTFPDL
jgi:hypothetical protein